jgi:hypothetical protein
MDWNSGSRGRMPTLQVQSLEFKSQSHQKKKKKNKQRGRKSWPSKTPERTRGGLYEILKTPQCALWKIPDLDASTHFTDGKT